MKFTLITTGRCAAAMLVFSLMAEGWAASSVPGATPCADPAADIELALISKTGPAAGRVRITAVVKNLGNAAWTATSPSHHLQMLLARRDKGARPEGEAVQPAIAIRQLAPGQQYRIDHQLDWEAGKQDAYPRFLASFSDAGLAGAQPSLIRTDCRSDNNRREITAADIDRLFQPPAPPPPLKVVSYRLLGGVGVNTVETQLVYRRETANAAKLTATVAAPHTSTSDDVPLNGDSGTAKIRVHIPCDAPEAPGANPPAVTITYRLWGTLGLPGGAGWVPGFGVEQSLPYRELCGAGPADQPNP